MHRTELLGSASFKKAYGLRYAYLGGAMYKGIASADMVIQLGKNGYLGYLGSGGLTSKILKANVEKIQAQLSDNYPYGVNLLCYHDQPSKEDELVDSLLHFNVRNVEAAAFMQITKALARYRCLGLFRDANGIVQSRHRILAKISRPEVAKLFLKAIPMSLVQKLLIEGKINQEQAELSQHIPVADDICCEADSAGHTDQAVMCVLLPAIIQLKNDCIKEYQWKQAIHVGIAGGIGTPWAAASAFILGADFILTGSINQCSVEAGTSEKAKLLLANAGIQDTAIAPAGDMFELGAKVQVLSRGTLFHARANKLYDLYRYYDAISDIPREIIQTLEEKYFTNSLAKIWEETKNHYEQSHIDQIIRADQNSKHKMALIFKWYFVHSTRLAMQGIPGQEANYQIQCGPAMGAFNQMVKNTPLAEWKNRRVADIAHLILDGAAQILTQNIMSQHSNKDITSEYVI